VIQLNKNELIKAIGLIVLLAIVLTLAIAFIQFNQGLVEERISPEEKAMNLIQEHKTFKSYIEGKGFSYETEILLEETVKELNEELGLELNEKELIQVNFTHQKLGNYTAFVDLDSEEVKIYRLTGVSLN
jgi:hypothetical protein